MLQWYQFHQESMREYDKHLQRHQHLVIAV